ncbi:MAG: sensor histidine kinase, partial [Clostridium sp.]
SENIAIFSIYSLIIYLYMDALYKRDISEKDLKSSYKIEREENYKLIEKLAYMDNYRKHSNIMAQINERNYIAQSLHDKLGHSVTSSIMQLQVSKAMMDKDKNLSLEYLNSAISNLSEGMDDIRLVLKNLKPQEEIIGIESIRTLLLEFQKNSGIVTSLNVNGDIAVIESDTWIVIEDNLKEAVTNSYKYSNATKFEMTIDVYNKFIRIDIRDNGNGTEKISKGLGLRGMEERIKSIDGNINFLSNNGFSISMIIRL